MKITVRRLVSFILAFSLASAMITTFAVARSSAYLDAYRAGCTPNSNGEIAIWVDVSGTKAKMDRIGADKIYLYESTDGTNFTRVKIFKSADYPNMMVSNANEYYKTAVTYQGTVGNYYYAVVYVYAEYNGGSDTKTYETSTKQARI